MQVVLNSFTLYFENIFILRTVITVTLSLNCTEMELLDGNLRSNPNFLKIVDKTVNQKTFVYKIA